MADFAAILKRAIDALGDPSSAKRERVYQRARDTLANRLAVVGPPSEAIAERQALALEEAIAAIESSYSREERADPIPQPDNAGPPDAPSAIDGPTGQIEDIAAQPIEPIASTILDGERAGVVELDARIHRAETSEIVSEQATFQVRGKARGSFGNRVFDGFPQQDLSIGSQITRLNVPVVQHVRELGWARSSLCGLCRKWALCVDQTNCWQRIG